MLALSLNNNGAFMVTTCGGTMFAGVCFYVFGKTSAYGLVVAV